MELSDILADPENRHIPLIGLTDAKGIIISPDMLLTGTYESALAYFGDTPVLYGATLSFAASAIAEGIRVELIPDRQADMRFGPGYASRHTTLTPNAAGSYAISRTAYAIDEHFRLFHRGYDLDDNALARPKEQQFFLSEMTSEMDEEDIRHAIGSLGHLVPTDILRLTYERDYGQGPVIATVRQLLIGYQNLEPIMREEFEMNIAQKKRLIIEDIDDRRDGKAPSDKYSQFLWDPQYELWPHALPPAEYYRQAQAKPTRGKKR